MKRIAAAEFEALKRGAAVLSRDEHGEKVLATPDGRIIKIFRRKRLVSSAWLRPYARRFCDAARELRRRGIATVEALDVFRIRGMQRDAVVYRRLEGAELRDVLRGDPGRREALLERLAKFLAQLHAAGVYFRAIHFGNVLVQPDGELALIDVSEARFRRGSLAMPLRVRNFRPLRSYDVDAAALGQFGIDRFIEAYMNDAAMEANLRADFRARAGRVLREPSHRSVESG